VSTADDLRDALDSIAHDEARAELERLLAEVKL